MADKKIRRSDALNALINGTNIYTNEQIIGLDDNLKKDLNYILDFILKAQKKQSSVEVKEKAIEKPKAIVLREGNIVVDNQSYRLSKGAVYNSKGMKIPDQFGDPILYKYYSNIDYSKFSEEEFLEFIKGAKDAKCNKLCIDIIEKEIEIKHDYEFLRAILPIYSSSCRGIKKPEKAIFFWESKSQELGMYISVAFFTSLAAAYCDVEDWEKAKHYADSAYAMQGGGTGYNTELSLVYKRIKKEHGDF